MLQAHLDGGAGRDRDNTTDTWLTWTMSEKTLAASSSARHPSRSERKRESDKTADCDETLKNSDCARCPTVMPADASPIFAMASRRALGESEKRVTVYRASSWTAVRSPQQKWASIRRCLGSCGCGLCANDHAYHRASGRSTPSPVIQKHLGRLRAPQGGESSEKS